MYILPYVCLLQFICEYSLLGFADFSLLVFADFSSHSLRQSSLAVILTFLPVSLSLYPALISSVAKW